MRATKISAIILVGLLVLVGGCASPSATIPVASSPAAAVPATPAPVAAVPAPVVAAPAPVAAAPAPVVAAPAAPAAPAPVAVAPAPVVAVPVVAAPAAPISVPGQPVFTVSNLVKPEACVAGDNVTFSVAVTNTGKQRGTYTVVLKFDGDTVQTQDVTLDGGSSENVQLNVQPNVIGVYQVTVNDQLSAKFEVSACPV